MELTIGRAANNSALSITVDGQAPIQFGGANSVPQSVSRQHCKIVRQGEQYQIINLNQSNSTYVNGLQVEEKSFNPQCDSITLSSKGYPLDLVAILKLIFPKEQTPPPAEQAQSYSIRHLEKIWNDNHDTKLAIQIKEKKTAAIRSATGLISTASLICAFVPGLESARLILVLLGVAVGIYFAITTYRSAHETPLLLDKLDTDFHDRYTCPNPACGHFLGYQPYRDIKKKNSCLYCRCKWTI